MAIELRVPSVGESITSVEVGDWLKSEGDTIRKDETLVTIDSEKATVEVPAPAAGRLSKIVKRKGEPARIGDVIAEIDERAAAQPAAPSAAPPPSTSKPEPPKPQASPAQPSPPPPPPREAAREEPRPARVEEIVHMTSLRRTIARRLVEARQQMALLTTFNEIDMSAVMTLRKTWGEAFQKKHGVTLGLMSFFVRAAVDALRGFPQLNAEVRGDDIVNRAYCDIGIAVSTSRGLVVPVLTGADRMSVAGIERSIADFARRAEENTLKPEELEGGTFTITNGGVFGSLLSTPIVNPPQSAILGMHAIQDRPIAQDGQVIVRPMMYVALTYDHRIIDGRDAVLFLHRVKDAIETPERMLIEA